MGEVIRKTKGGRFIGWYIRYIDSDGRRKQRASHQSTYQAARRLLVQIEARVVLGQAGLDDRAPAQQRLTVAELFDRFAGEVNKPKVKNIERYRTRSRFQLQRIVKAAPQLVRLPLSELTSAHVGKIRDALGRICSRGTVRNSLIAFSSCLSWAVSEDLMPANVVKGVERPPPPPPQLQFLSVDEVRRLLAEAERRARADSRKNLSHFSRFVAVSLGLRLGLRRGEIFGLRWQDIDFDGGRITIARSYGMTPKNGKPRHLRLPQALVPILREWNGLCPKTPEGLVCPVSYRGKFAMARATCVSHAVPALFRAAGCRVLPRPWHLLRHTFASHFVQSGGSLLALAQILGHSDVKMTMIYAHLSPDFLAEQLDRVKF